MEEANLIKWVRMEEFLNMDFPHQIVVGNDLLDGGEKLCIFGPSEAGKSYWLIQLANCLATATPFLGYPIPVKKRVLILQSELSPRRYQERLAKMAQSYEGDMDIWVWSIEDMKVDVPERKEEFAKAIGEIRPDVVIIDPLRAFFSGDENSSEAVEKLFTAFAELQKVYNFSLIYAHHVRKGVPGFEDSVTKASVRGSSLLTDRPSTAIALEVNETQSEWKMSVVKGRNMDKRPDAMLLTVDFDSGLFIPNGTITSTARYEPLLEYIGDGAKKVDCVGWLLSRGYTQSGAYDHISAAANRGLVSVSGNGRVVTPTKPEGVGE